MKETMKKVAKVSKEQGKAEGKKLLSVAYKAIDKAAKKGVVKKNTASRNKSLLSRITK